MTGSGRRPRRRPELWLWLLLWSALGLGRPPAAPAAELMGLRQTLDLQADGSARVTVEVWPAPGQNGGTCELPLGVATATEVQIAGTAGPVAATPITTGGRLMLPIDLAGRNGDRIVVSYRTPAVFEPKKAERSPWGNLTVTHAWCNLTPNRIASAELVILLPAGLLVNTVDDSTPTPSREDPNLPFRLDRDGERHRLTIGATALQLGDALSLTFRMKAGGRSKLLVLLVLLAIGAWLLGMRDLIRPQSPVGVNATPPGGT